MSRDLLTGVATPPQAINTRVVIAGLHGISLLLLALHIYVRTLLPTSEPIPTAADAEAAWWGLWPVTYLPALWFWLGVIVVLATMVWSWRFLLFTSPANFIQVATQSPRPSWKDPGLSEAAVAEGALRGDKMERSPLGWLYALSALLLIAFYLFPIIHTRWGDAYLLSKSIAWPDPALRLTHSWQAPLDLFLHSQLWLAFGLQRGWQDAMPVYHLLSPIAGTLYLAVLLQLAADRDLAPGWLTYGLLASLGLVQLFFGYVENYSFAAAGILAFLWLGRRVLQSRSPLWLATLLLAITNATHPSTIILGPALLYVGWVLWRRGTTPLLRIVVEIALPLLLVATGTLALMEAGGHGLAAIFTTDRPGGSDASWFVPIWGTRTRWEAYTLLSWHHLRDLLNQMLLVAPVILPSLLWLSLVAKRGVAGEQSETQRFLPVAALAHLLLMIIWNPDYGGQRDWDLFSLAWIPTTLPLVLLQALHSAAWVYQNTLPWTWP
jgi:hypothetical protein